MVGLLIILLAVGAALLAAASMRLASLVSSLLVAYLALAANLVIVVVALSPFREVSRGGLAGAEAILFAGALVGWWLRGRPRLLLWGRGPPLAPAAGAGVVAGFAAV